MGMFDWVTASGLKCGACGTDLPEHDFQSKDSECRLAHLSASEVRNFYTSCPKCHQWLEFRVEPTGYRIVPLPLLEK
jgi:hypothetical protein